MADFCKSLRLIAAKFEKSRVPFFCEKSFIQFISVPLLKWIPKGARQQCLNKFCAIISDIVKDNSLAAWERLLHFPTRCLRVPTRSGDKRTLTTKVNNQIVEETDPVWDPTRKKKCRSYENDENVFMKGLGKKVSAKL